MELFERVKGTRTVNGKLKKLFKKIVFKVNKKLNHTQEKCIILIDHNRDGKML
jgi:hypothetical protein